MDPLSLRGGKTKEGAGARISTLPDEDNSYCGIPAVLNRGFAGHSVQRRAHCSFVDVGTDCHPALPLDDGAGAGDFVYRPSNNQTNQRIVFWPFEPDTVYAPKEFDKREDPITYRQRLVINLSTMEKQSQSTPAKSGSLPPIEFAEDAQKFIARCTKPDKSEYFKIVRAVGAGFLMMGAIGYAVKLVHIPIRHLITV